MLTLISFLGDFIACCDILRERVQSVETRYGVTNCRSSQTCWSKRQLMTIGNSVGLFVFLSQWLSSFLLSAKQFLFMNRNALIVVFFVFTIVFFVLNLVDLRQEVYVFASVYVCLFVCLCAT